MVRNHTGSQSAGGSCKLLGEGLSVLKKSVAMVNKNGSSGKLRIQDCVGNTIVYDGGKGQCWMGLGQGQTWKELGKGVDYGKTLCEILKNQSFKLKIRNVKNSFFKSQFIQRGEMQRLKNMIVDTHGPSRWRSQCVVEYSILCAQEPRLKKVGTNNS